MTLTLILSRSWSRPYSMKFLNSLFHTFLCALTYPPFLPTVRGDRFILLSHNNWFQVLHPPVSLRIPPLSYIVNSFFTLVWFPSGYKYAPMSSILITPLPQTCHFPPVYLIFLFSLLDTCKDQLLHPVADPASKTFALIESVYSKVTFHFINTTPNIAWGPHSLWPLSDTRQCQILPFMILSYLGFYNTPISWFSS